MKDDTVFLNAEDTIGTHTARRQRTINKLLPLFNQGFPVVYASGLSKCDMIMRYNLLLYRSLHGYFDFIHCKDKEEYEKEAFRTCGILRRLSARISQGGRVRARVKPLQPLADGDNHPDSAVSEQITIPSAITCDICGKDLGVDERCCCLPSPSDTIRHELKQVEPSMRQQLLKNLLEEQNQ